jgi:glutaredoxin
MESIRRALRRSARDPVSVILFSRPGCHLCEDARALLQRIAAPGEILIEEVDITTDPALVRAYDLLIPVIRIAGTELSAPIGEADLRRALTAARRN